MSVSHNIARKKVLAYTILMSELSVKNPYSCIWITDGLSSRDAQKRYRERRSTLAQKIGYTCVIFGTDTLPGDRNNWAHVPSFIYQEPLMLFLTGINQPKVALVLNPNHSHQEILFIPPKNAMLEFWEGKKFGFGSKEDLEEITDITGIAQVYPIETLETYLSTQLTSASTMGLYWHSSPTKTLKDPLFDKKSKLIRALKRKGVAPAVVNIAHAQWQCRLPLDATDFKNAQTANAKTADAFKKTLPVIPTCKSETEVSGILAGEIQKRSYFGHSFPSIIASGKNATILHYTKNNDTFSPQELLLLDFGVRWQGMHADISRTVPISGKFNPLQRLLYTLVLDAQARVEKHAKPGVTLEELNTLCWTFINSELDSKIRSNGGQANLPYATQPHNVSHYIGLQVHDGDPFRLYKKTPLAPGMMISNEPGLYGHFSMTLENVLYTEWIGIRIEDDLWITASGCINLSRDCPKTIDEIEALMAS